jgi:hypothetical protein
MNSGAKVLAWVVHKATQILDQRTAAVLLSTSRKLSSLVKKLLRPKIQVHLLLLLTHLRNVKLQSHCLSGRRLAISFLAVFA